MKQLFNKSESRSHSSPQRRFLNQEKKYNNPFFDKKPKRKPIAGSGFRLPQKAKIIASLLLISPILLIWFLLYSSYFDIKSIEARGGGRLDPTEIESIAWKQIKDSNFALWPEKNIFIFDRDDFLASLNLKYSLNGAILSKKLPSKLLIEYNEKEHSIIWQEQGIFYFCDDQGYIVERIGNEMGEKQYPLIVNDSPIKIEGNRVGPKPEMISFALQAAKWLKDKPGLEYSHFLIKDDSSSIRIKLKSGPFLVLSSSVELERQMEKVMLLKDEILKDDFVKKEYLDVRTGDRVYYK